MKKPENIVYWLKDKPPAAISVFIGLQQMSFLGVYLVISPLFVRAENIDGHDSQILMATTLLVSGIGVMFQAAGRFGIGSGYFCPLQVTSASFATLELARLAGGLELAFGMVGVMGAAQVLFGEMFRRLRGIFSVELAGVAVTLVGLGLGYKGVTLLAGVDAPGGLWKHDIAIGFLALAVMIVCNVWSSGSLRLFSAFAGLAVGLAVSVLVDGVRPEDAESYKEIPLLEMPKLPTFGWAFDPALIVPYVVLGLAFSLHGFGALAAAQRFNDSEWRHPDMAQISRGIRAEGVSNLIAGLVNGLPLTSSGGAVSLAAATGCTSRHIAYWLGGIMIILAFVPKITVLWLVLPVPVIGAAAVFLSSFTLLAGLQMIASRMLDNRKILTVGIGLLLGFSHEPLKHFYREELPSFLVPVTQSSVALGVAGATLLSGVFRIGAGTRRRRSFVLGQSQLDDVIAYLDHQGRAWGACAEVVRRSEYAIWQAFEILHDHDFVARDEEGRGVVEVETLVDEFTFTVIARYRGEAIPVSTHAPSHEELLESDTGILQMAGYLLYKLADRVRSRELSKGMAEFRLTFVE
ncbi:solute carrier family 23 protein [Methylococcus geothermalis]|uniref:Xanthine/uracil permease n=1 Tax=Methylococcus geothermalis TaxID=2681310 RepID=A0A858Q852_9GAMM|nr:solute carrier family 23 protein [Methylococcus geothermalis]QJD29954.1 xanthine/uracil permease [Methylococcus geothermalis]